MIDAVKRWADRAEYDLETARALLASKRYLYVLFCCQQSIEKALKAVIVSKTGELPPRIHNLPRLAELAGLAANQDRMQLLAQLSTFYIQSRYPEDIDVLAASTTNVDAQKAIRQTEELIKWLLSLLK